MRETILVTGGAGFIGSALVRFLIRETDANVVNVDKLTYAGDLASLESVSRNERYAHEKVDITDAARIAGVFERYRPTKVMHLAAESHVDRSIDGPAVFVTTNVLGTQVLLEAARRHWTSLDGEGRRSFRFLHVSTDEVYGFLGSDGFFSEETPYRPSSPYSASKAASDHLVRAWQHTFGMPTLVTNCSNNYGPWQFPEKLIPVVINNALHGKAIPIYGRGANVRDWLFVDDHVRALWTVLKTGRVGETYLVGGRGERTNLELATAICRILDELAPNPKLGRHESLMTFVTDRLGHDFRYAIDPSKLESELGWRAQVSLDSGLRTTVKWYLDNQPWCQRLLERLQRS